MFIQRVGSLGRSHRGACGRSDFLKTRNCNYKTSSFLFFCNEITELAVVQRKRERVVLIVFVEIARNLMAKKKLALNKGAVIHVGLLGCSSLLLKQ